MTYLHLIFLNILFQSKVYNLCCTYKQMPPEDKQKFIWSLALQYSVDHQKICGLAEKLSNVQVFFYDFFFQNIFSHFFMNMINLFWILFTVREPTTDVVERKIAEERPDTSVPLALCSHREIRKWSKIPRRLAK